MADQLDSFLSAELKADIQILKELPAEVRSLMDAITAYNTVAKNAEGATSQARSLKELKERIKELEAANADLTKGQREFIKAVEESERIKQQEIKTERERLKNAKEEIALRQKANKEMDEQSRRRKREEKEVGDLNNAYAKLNKEHRELEKQAAHLGVLLGIKSKEFKNAADAANAAGNKLKEIDFALGRYGRNVGNYAGSLNSVNQILREVPNAGQSAQIFIMSLGNQIGQVQDDIRRLREQNALLIAQGEKAVPVWKQFANAFLGWNALLMIGVALVISYSKELSDWVSGLVKGKKAMDQAAESADTMHKAFTSNEAKEAVKNVDELRINIGLARQGILDKEKVVQQYNETIGKTTGLVKSLDEAEVALGRNADAYIKFTLLKAAAQMALAKAGEEMLKQAEKDLEVERENKRFGREKVDPTKIHTTDAAQQGDPQGVIREQERVKKQSQERLNGLTRIAEQFQEEAAKIAKMFRFNFSGDNKEPKAEKEVKLPKIADDEFLDGLEKDRKAVEGLADELERLYGNMTSLDDELRNSLKPKREIGADELKEMEFNHTLNQWRKKDRKDQEKQDKEEKRARIELLQAYAATASAIENSITDIFAAATQRRIDALEMEGELIDRNLEKELLSIKYSSMSRDEKNKKSMEAEKKAQQQHEVIEAKKRKERAELAKFERMMNIAQIIQRTALAVVTTLSDDTIKPGYLRIPLAVAVGAIGAAELIAAMSAPTPAYADGVDNHPGGRALIGEGGEPEIVKEPGKRPYVVDRAMLKNLPAGTRVIPEHDLVAAGFGMINPALVNMLGNNSRQLESIELSDKTCRKIGKYTSFNFNQTIVGIDYYKLKHVKGRG